MVKFIILQNAPGVVMSVRRFNAIMNIKILKTILFIIIITLIYSVFRQFRKNTIPYSKIVLNVRHHGQKQKTFTNRIKKKFAVDGIIKNEIINVIICVWCPSFCKQLICEIMKTYIHRSGRNFACMEAAIVKGPYLPCKGFS